MQVPGYFFYSDIKKIYSRSELNLDAAAAATAISAVEMTNDFLVKSTGVNR